jgi:hypothetical protein
VEPSSILFPLVLNSVLDSFDIDFPAECDDLAPLFLKFQKFWGCRYTLTIGLSFRIIGCIATMQEEEVWCAPTAYHSGDLHLRKRIVARHHHPLQLRLEGLWRLSLQSGVIAPAATPAYDVSSQNHVVKSRLRASTSPCRCSLRITRKS